MEIRDLSNSAAPAANDEPGASRSLERVESGALVPQGGDQRTELYARLRAIIDNATESIRTLKEENATLATQNTEMSGRIGTLEQRIRAVTADLAGDELALRRSAEVLEQVLKSPPEAAPPLEATAPPAPPPPGEPEGEMPVGDPSAETAQIPIPAEEEAVMEQEATPPTPEVKEPPTAPSVANVAAMEETAPAPRSVPSPDGTYTVIAYPFVRFSDLGQFQSALQKLTGVHDVQVRRFAQGTLEMHLGYTGATDLTTTLRSLAEVEDVREEEPSRLRVRLRTSQDA